MSLEVRWSLEDFLLTLFVTSGILAGEDILLRTSVRGISSGTCRRRNEAYLGESR